jgi:hypothetical protein
MRLKAAFLFAKKIGKFCINRLKDKKNLLSQ